MALVRFPIRVNDIQNLVNAGGDINDMGVTNPPGNFNVPDFNIVCQQTKNGWSVSIHIIQVASEGTNASYYLGTGLYPSNLMMSGRNITNYSPGPTNRRIYRIVTDDIADLNRKAEEEHCNDIIRAYQITLQAVQNAINKARQDLIKAQKRYDKQDQAMRAALDALVNADSHSRIQNIFRSAINTKYNIDRNKLRNDLSRLYLDIANMTQYRDSQGYHTLNVQRESESWNLRSWAEYSRYIIRPDRLQNYLYGEEKDIRDVIKSSTFKVPGPASSIVVYL